MWALAAYINLNLLKGIIGMSKMIIIIPMQELLTYLYTVRLFHTPRSIILTYTINYIIT